jgi:hypothetical protein
MKNRINDMTRYYDGFIIMNLQSKEQKQYPYRKGVNSIDAEAQAIKEQMQLQGCDRGALIINGLIKKGDF